MRRGINGGPPPRLKVPKGHVEVGMSGINTGRTVIINHADGSRITVSPSSEFCGNEIIDVLLLKPSGIQLSFSMTPEYARSLIEALQNHTRPDPIAGSVWVDRIGNVATVIRVEESYPGPIVYYKLPVSGAELVFDVCHWHDNFTEVVNETSITIKHPADDSKWTSKRGTIFKVSHTAEFNGKVYVYYVAVGEDNIRRIPVIDWASNFKKV